MKTRILTFILSLFLVLFFVGCGDDGGGTSDSGDSTSTTGTYTIADYVDFSTAQSWIDYDQYGNEETTTSTAYSSIGTTLINMYETTSNGDFESYTFEILDSGEYVANDFGELPFKDAFDEGVLLFPVSMDVGNTITRNYTGVLNAIDVGGTVKVTLDDHYDTFDNGVANFADVIKYTWVYIDGESTNDPVISLTFYMAKTVGLVKTVDNLEGGYSVRTDLASNVSTTTTTDDTADDTTTSDASVVPQNLLASDGDYNNFILVKWDAVANATSYMLFIDDGQGTETFETLTDNEYYDFDATDDYLYTYTVKAMVDGSWSDASESNTGYRAGYTGSVPTTDTSSDTTSSDGTFSSSTQVAIPDGDTTTGASSAITVSGATTSISKVTVTVNITHGFDGDVDFYLVSPNGTQVELSTDNGGLGDNFTDTVFDDSATTDIVDGSAPFTGTYAPEGSLADFNGEDANGDWTLKVYDDYDDDPDSGGTLDSWSITIE